MQRGKETIFLGARSGFNFSVEVTKENENEQFVNIGMGYAAAWVLSYFTLFNLPYDLNHKIISNMDIVDFLDINLLSLRDKKQKIAKTIKDFYDYLCISGDTFIRGYIDPNLVCKSMKERIETSKKRLANAKREDLKKWKVYFYRDEKWNKIPQLLRTVKSAYGLWGIHSKEELAILLKDVLIVEKPRNPMAQAFDIIKGVDFRGIVDGSAGNTQE